MIYLSRKSILDIGSAPSLREETMLDLGVKGLRLVGERLFRELRFS